MNKQEFIDFLKKTEKAYHELVIEYNNLPEKKYYEGKVDATRYIIKEMEENLNSIN